jgi:hypothetical protein
VQVYELGSEKQSVGKTVYGLVVTTLVCMCCQVVGSVVVLGSFFVFGSTSTASDAVPVVEAEGGNPFAVS